MQSIKYTFVAHRVHMQVLVKCCWPKLALVDGDAASLGLLGLGNDNI
jgi:hypothetical protein